MSAVRSSCWRSRSVWPRARTPRHAAETAAPSGACPTTPVDVVVSVDQWGDIVSELGGDCARVKTLLASSSVDPHDYEPTPADAASFEGAQLVVVNGAHYDEWAAKLAATSAPDAPVVSAATDSTTPRIRTSGTTRRR